MKSVGRFCRLYFSSDRHWAVNRAGQAAFIQQKHRGIFKNRFSLVEGIDAILKKVYGVDVPGKLDEDEWLRLYANTACCGKLSWKEFEIVVHNAVAKVVKPIILKRQCK